MLEYICTIWLSIDRNVNISIITLTMKCNNVTLWSILKIYIENSKNEDNVCVRTVKFLLRGKKTS